MIENMIKINCRILILWLRFVQSKRISSAFNILISKFSTLFASICCYFLFLYYFGECDCEVILWSKMLVVCDHKLKARINLRMNTIKYITLRKSSSHNLYFKPMSYHYIITLTYLKNFTHNFQWDLKSRIWCIYVVLSHYPLAWQTFKSLV